MKGDKRVKTCEIHNVEYEQTEMGFTKKEWWVGDCPECQKIEEERVKILEEKEARQKDIEFYKRQNIEPMYYDIDIDGFIADTEELKKAKQVIQELIETKKGKVLMIGKNGTGKTHLAIAALKGIGYGRIFTMFEISTRIRETYTNRAKETEMEILEELSNADMLIIDELGRTKGSEAEENWLSYIIDKRNSRFLPLIIISNNHLKKNCADGGCNKCLENYVSDDVISRLREDGIVLNFTGDDFRKKKTGVRAER